MDAHPYNGGVKASVYIDYDSMNNLQGEPVHHDKNLIEPLIFNAV